MKSKKKRTKSEGNFIFKRWAERAFKWEQSVTIKEVGGKPRDCGFWKWKRKLSLGSSSWVLQQRELCPHEGTHCHNSFYSPDQSQELLLTKELKPHTPIHFQILASPLRTLVNFLIATLSTEPLLWFTVGQKILQTSLFPESDKKQPSPSLTNLILARSV